MNLAEENSASISRVRGGAHTTATYWYLPVRIQHGTVTQKITVCTIALLGSPVKLIPAEKERERETPLT
jgi:hypothetical protein